MAKKITKKATKTLKNMAKSTLDVSKSRTITVKNADGELDTTAKILIQNKIEYTPKVSVIIPVYNVENYLRECLDSVVNQTLREIEIICVDDGSTDNSLAILQEYAARDNRITVITQQNLHAGVARNAGLAVAKGEYLLFLDSDDFFERNMLEEMYNKAISDKVDIVVCAANKVIDSKIESLSWAVRKNYLNSDTFSCSDLKTAQYIFQAIVGFPWNKLISKKLVNVNGFHFCSSHHHNDTSFVMSCVVAADKISYISVPYVNYRMRQDSICRAKKAYPECMYESIIATYNGIKNLPDYKNVSQSFINYIVDFMNHYYKTHSEDMQIHIVPYIKKIYQEFKLSDYKDEYFYDKDKFNNIKRIVFSTTVPIILASDDNYAPFMYITMVSILENAKKDSFYDFYLMVPSAFSPENQQKIYGLKDKYNCEIHFIDMKGAFSDLTMRIAHITSPTYYRLLAGDLLPQYYDKCIYLDVDICVCQDLAQLYNTDMGDNYIAGVVAPGYYFDEQSNCKRLNLPSMKTYVNAGVLLMNLKQIRADNLTKEFIKLSKNNFSSQDQDVVNIACFGKIKTLSPKYNVMTMRFAENDKRLRELWSEQDIAEAKTHPVIIHYADKIKPWKNPLQFMAHYWYDVARKTPYIASIVHNTDIYVQALSVWYKNKFHRDLNLDNPKTYNEKIQWSKIYDSRPIKTKLADKYLVRDWVAEKIGDKYLIPLLGVYDSFEEIDFDKLPNRFVIKCNHGCGYNIIVKDKSNINLADVKTKLDKWMTENFAFHTGCEMQYRDIKPKIIIEQFIENKKSGGDLYDYKFWCFDGKVYYIQFLSERNLDGLKMAFYDKQWNKQNFVYSYPLDTKNIEKPSNLDEMIELAEKLSAGFNHVRVDFYRMDDGTIYFGEMTFTSASGACKWNDEKIDLYFGNLFKLPKLAYNIDTGEYYKLPHVKNHVVKPYLLFPYYLMANVLMKSLKLPMLRFKKHVKSVLFSHSLRGKNAVLNANFNRVFESVQSVKNDMQSQINLLKNQINNQQKLFEPKFLETNKKIDAIQNKIALDINELSDKLKEFFNKNADIVETKYHELSENISKNITVQNDNDKRIEDAVVDVKNQIRVLEKNTLDSSDKIIAKMNSDKKDLNANIEHDRVMYFNTFETTTRLERGLCDIVDAPDFENRFKKLISGLSADDVATIVKIIRRLQLIKGTNSKLDLFTKDEKDLLQRVRDFNKEILKISDNLYVYKNYLLPINHFEASVFFYNHGIGRLDSVDSFKNKDILDIGGFIGDSVLMLSPYTNKKVYSFEATKENYDLMLKTIELNNIKNAIPVHAAVGDKNGEIELRFNGSVSSQDDKMVKEPKYIEKCKMIKIDDYVREHNIDVGLIKVDIEGAEQAFLRGARETITKYKPTLLISIYHNVNDFLDIKPMIESWNLGYKFKIFKPVIESISGETLLICEQ